MASYVISRNGFLNETPGKVPVPLDSGVNAELGLMLVQVAGYGQLPAAGNAATGRMCGIVIEPANNTGAQGSVSAVCEPRTAAFANDGTHPCSQADVGKLVYASSPTTISNTSSDGPKAGKLIQYDTAQQQGRPCVVALDCMLTA